MNVAKKTKNESFSGVFSFLKLQLTCEDNLFTLISSADQNAFYFIKIATYPYYKVYRRSARIWRVGDVIVICDAYKWRWGVYLSKNVKRKFGNGRGIRIFSVEVI